MYPRLCGSKNVRILIIFIIMKPKMHGNMHFFEFWKILPGMLKARLCFKSLAKCMKKVFGVPIDIMMQFLQPQCYLNMYFAKTRLRRWWLLKDQNFDPITIKMLQHFNVLVDFCWYGNAPMSILRCLEASTLARMPFTCSMVPQKVILVFCSAQILKRAFNLINIQKLDQKTLK